MNNNGSFTLDVPKEYGTVDGKDHSYTIPDGATFFYNIEYIHKMNQFETKWNHNNNDKSGINNCRNDQVCFSNWIDDKTGKLKKTSEMPFMAFGIGPRDCAGRKLAENEIQMLLALLLLNYKFSFNEKKYGKNGGGIVINDVLKRATLISVDPTLSVQIQSIV